MAKSAMRKTGLIEWLVWFMIMWMFCDDVSFLSYFLLLVLFRCLEFCCQLSSVVAWSSGSQYIPSVWFGGVCVFVCSSRCCRVVYVLENKIYHNLRHPLNDVVSSYLRRIRQTRAAEITHDFVMQLFKCRTEQFERCFVNSMRQIWNSLPGVVFGGGSLDGFKRATNRWLVGWYFNLVVCNCFGSCS